uniref:Carnitine dehydratase n=1 Tax=Sphingobium baderi TaxID=1332080 RepID=A0A144J2I2_9SPHN|nr:carnitine dehydratase [Sphingobium baderi]
MGGARPQREAVSPATLRGGPPRNRAASCSAACPSCGSGRERGAEVSNAKGPLAAIRVVEFAGLGPAPFAGMMFSDMGADVLRIERKGASDPTPERLDARGRRTIILDLKQPDAVALCLDICDKAEAVFEGNRPGVMERLGLGPGVMLTRNPRLVYGRMTGWGQFGPLATAAGHDINYLALTGALHAALLQRLAAVRGRLSLCADQAAAAKWWLSMPMASVSAEGPMPKALSTRRTSPLMPGCRHQGRACPLRRARMTSNPLIVA